MAGEFSCCLRAGPIRTDDSRSVTLPAGSYYAIAVDYVEPGESNDPDFLERVRTKATTFSLNDGETKTLDLKLNSSS